MCLCNNTPRKWGVVATDFTQHKQGDNKMNNIIIKKEVKNVSIELLGNRIIITSNDDNRTELHFDNNGNQLHTWIDRKFNKVKTKVHSFIKYGMKNRKTFIFDSKEGWSDVKRVMFFDK